MHRGRVHMVLFTIAHIILLGCKTNGFQLKQLEQYLLRPLHKLAHTPGPLPRRSLQYAEKKCDGNLKGMMGHSYSYFLFLSQSLPFVTPPPPQTKPPVDCIVMKDWLTHSSWQMYLADSVWGRTELNFVWNLGREREDINRKFICWILSVYFSFNLRRQNFQCVLIHGLT